MKYLDWQANSVSYRFQPFCSDLFEWRNSQVGCSLTLNVSSWITITILCRNLELPLTIPFNKSKVTFTILFKNMHPFRIWNVSCLRLLSWSQLQHYCGNWYFKLFWLLFFFQTSAEDKDLLPCTSYSRLLPAGWDYDVCDKD